MSFITAVPREQLMLPVSIDEYVPPDNMVRRIDDFVDKLLKSKTDFLFKKGNSSEGRPSYSPNCLCKLLIYGYLNEITSSRKLENETKRNLEVIWLMNRLQPDHWTISDFRKENKDLIIRITIDFCKFSELRQSEKEIERYFARFNENDAGENDREELIAANKELQIQVAELQKQVEKLKSQKTA